MANENIGFAKLMRFCATTADFEAAKAAGTVTDDVLVIVVAEKLAKFKGETFDWSGGGGVDASKLATREELQNLTDEVIKNEETIVGIVKDADNKIASQQDKQESTEKDVSTLREDVIDNELVMANAVMKVDEKLKQLEKRILALEDNL